MFRFHEFTTNDSVRGIVLPETAHEKTCYMDSEFMKVHGGGSQRPRVQPSAAPRRSVLSSGFSNALVADDSGVAVGRAVAHDLLLVSVRLLVVWQLERLQELPRVRT